MEIDNRSEPDKQLRFSNTDMFEEFHDTIKRIVLQEVAFPGHVDDVCGQIKVVQSKAL